jgi:serine/threonine protein kinase
MPAPGDRIGSYEVLSLLGAGGMGEVYRARDTKLGRDVAIKVLAASIADDTDLIARFEREARALAALNHPNVGAIYGIEHIRNNRALVLELVEGPTLADRIRQSSIAPREALRIATAIARGVDAAHRKGIIHRDLKPANIKLVPDGSVKVLDFGLAKVTDPRDTAGATTSTTVFDGTQAGVVMGTVGYMSPEQARGDAVDARTDIWAFGCVLYEMLAGRRAFDGRTSSDVVAAVLEREPDWARLPRSTPPAVRDLLKWCLAKAADERPPEMADVRARLELSLADREATRLAPRGAIAAVALLLVAAMALLWLTPATSISTPDSTKWEQLTNFSDSATQPALSPDGRMLTFIRGEGTMAAPGQVYLKHLPHGDAMPLTSDQTMKMDPVFSADGNRIAYTVAFDASSMASGWDTWDVPVVRGEPRRWLTNAASPTWIGANALLFSRIRQGQHMGVVMASEAGGTARDVYFPRNEARMVHRTAMSPDRRWILMAEMDELGVFGPCLLIAAANGSTPRPVGPASGPCTAIAWAPDGRYMYFTADAGDGMHIWRQRFPDGVAEQLTTGTATQEEGLAMAHDGRSVVSSVGQQRRGVWLRDATGERQISTEGYAFWPLLSSDGATLVFRVSRGTAGGRTPSELWKADLKSGRLERLLPGRMVVQHDLSRDNRVVAAVIEDDGSSRLWVASIDGREPPRRLGIAANSVRAGVADDIVYAATQGQSLYLFRTDVNGAPPRRVGPNPIGGVIGTISPDGRWLTDSLNGVTVAVSTAGEAAVPILKNAVARMRWSPDGKHALLAVQGGAGPSAFGFGKTYVLPIAPGHSLPRVPTGGFGSENELAAAPGVQILQYADLAFGSEPGVYVFSKITATRNLFRIPLP